MPISRRDFIKTGLAAAAMAAGAFALKSAKQDGAGSAQAQANQPPPAQNTPTTGRRDFTYRGRKVRIDETDRGVDVTIGGKHQHHVQKKTPRGGPPYYVSHMMPFENFPSAVILVETLIDREQDMELFDLS